MREIHKYTPKSVEKTVYLNVFLGALIVSQGFYSKTAIQKLSENWNRQAPKYIIKNNLKYIKVVNMTLSNAEYKQKFIEYIILLILGDFNV